MAGRAFVFGDDVDTDALAPGAWLKFGIETIAAHCLASLDASFARQVRPGDVLVAGRNFGTGSSREQAVAALRHLGIAAVVARSYAGIFHRNAINLGLPVLVCADAGDVRAGERIAVDVTRATVTLPERGRVLACEALPEPLDAILAAGGLLPWLERRLAAQRSSSSPP